MPPKPWSLAYIGLHGLDYRTAARLAYYCFENRGFGKAVNMGVHAVLQMVLFLLNLGTGVVTAAACMFLWSSTWAGSDTLFGWQPVLGPSSASPWDETGSMRFDDDYDAGMGIMVWYDRHGLYLMVAVVGFAVGAGIFSVVTSIVEASVCTTLLCFAEDPNTMQGSQPEVHHILMQLWIRHHPDELRDCGYYIDI